MIAFIFKLLCLHNLSKISSTSLVYSEFKNFFKGLRLSIVLVFNKHQWIKLFLIFFPWYVCWYFLHFGEIAFDYFWPAVEVVEPTRWYPGPPRYPNWEFPQLIDFPRTAPINWSRLHTPERFLTDYIYFHELPSDAIEYPPFSNCWYNYDHNRVPEGYKMNLHRLLWKGRLMAATVGICGVWSAASFVGICGVAVAEFLK